MIIEHMNTNGRDSAFVCWAYDAQGRVIYIGRNKADYLGVPPEQRRGDWGVALWETFKIPRSQCCVPHANEMRPAPQSATDWDQMAAEKAARLGVTAERVRELWIARRDAQKAGDHATARAITAQLTPPKSPPKAPASLTIKLTASGNEPTRLAGELANVARFARMLLDPKYSERAERMRLSQIENRKKWEAQMCELVRELKADGIR